MGVSYAAQRRVGGVNLCRCGGRGAAADQRVGVGIRVGRMLLGGGCEHCLD